MSLIIDFLTQISMAMQPSTIAARIKQARQMADLKTQAQLLRLIPSWKSSRLGNYEAGISTPGSEDVVLIAQATGVSACWLMFGHGPIRPTQRDLQAIRYQNLIQTVEHAKNASNYTTKLAKELDMTTSQLKAHLANPFLPIDDQCAANLETFLNKAPGWADEQHIENDPVCASFPDDLRELMLLYSGMNTDNRQLSLELLRVIANKDAAASKDHD